MANTELKNKYNWRPFRRDTNDDGEDDSGRSGSGAPGTSGEVDIERASRILNLCNTSLDEIKKAKSQVLQLTQYVERAQQNANVDWLEGVDRTKKLERFGRVLGMLTSAIGKLEVLLANMYGLTKGLGLSNRRGMSLGGGSSSDVTSENADAFERRVTNGEDKEKK